MSGAFTTTQGNCSSFKFQTPHSCQKSAVIADLMPDALPENRTENCCNAGLLAAWAINPSKSFSSFKMKVANLGANPKLQAPLNLILMAPGPGYTCGLVEDTDPTVSSDIGVKDNSKLIVSTQFNSIISQCNDQYSKATKWHPGCDCRCPNYDILMIVR